MSNQNNSSREENLIGGAIVLLIVLYFVFSILLKAVVIAALCIGAYRLYVYDKRTGSLTAKAEKFFDLEPVQDVPSLESPSYFEDELDLEPINEVKYTPAPEPVPVFSKDAVAEVVKETIATYGESIVRQKGADLMNEVFGSNPQASYDQSSTFEIQQEEENRRKKQKELDNRSFELSLNEQFFEFTDRIVDRQRSTEDRQRVLEGQVTALGQVVLEGFNTIAQEIMGINYEIKDLRGYVDQKVSHLENTFIKELYSVREMIQQVNTRLTTEVSDVKLQFGKEVLRLDQHQMRIVSKLGDFSNKLQAYGNELSKVKIEADRREMRGEAMLKQAQLVHQQHKGDIALLSKDLGVGLQRMAMYDQAFAQKLGSAKIELEGRAKEMRHAVQEMGYERVGINAMRENLSNQEQHMTDVLNQRTQKIQHLKEQISLERSRDNNVSQLQHQLQMTQVQRQREAARAEWVRRENTHMRKLN